mgnify:CR=1 FL=1
MKTTTLPSRPCISDRERGRGVGFTLVEVLFSVLIIGVLMGLLIVGFRSARTFTQSVGDRTAVANIKAAVAKFNAEFGFPPPLVCDQAPQAVTTGPMPHGARSSIAPNGPDRSRFAVYNFSRDASNADLTVLRPATLTLPGAANPFEDDRYSERTIAYYLAGACDTERDRALSLDVPIDGVAGLGFYTPNIDGTFDVPADVSNPQRNTGDRITRRRKAAFESFIDISGKAVSIAHSTPSASEGQAAADPNNRRAVAVVDGKGVPIRYYRWLHAEPLDGIEDYRIPPLVGRANIGGNVYPGAIPADRDIAENPQLRDATYAIVAAGPNGAFGDEPIDELMRRMGRNVNTASASDVIKLRIDAEKDNIVEVGK